MNTIVVVVAAVAAAVYVHSKDRQFRSRFVFSACMCAHEELTLCLHQNHSRSEQRYALGSISTANSGGAAAH